jgi:hypothetical protein
MEHKKDFERRTKNQLLDILLSDFFSYFNAEDNEFNICSIDESVNISVKGNNYFIHQYWTPTRKSVKQEYNMTFRELLTKAEYIEWTTSVGCYIWSKKGFNIDKRI